MMLEVYLGFSILFHIYMFTIWKKSDFVNISLKTIFLVLFVVGILIGVDVWELYK